MHKSILTAFALTAAACSPAPSPPPPPPVASQPAFQAPRNEAELLARIDRNVFDPYTREDYPKLYAKLGKPDPTRRIQALREAAARKAMASGRCDSVQISEVSDQRTSKASISVFVDCTNRERFYVSEADVAGDSAIAPNSDRTLSRKQAVASCVEAAKALTFYPSLMDAHVWTGASYGTDKTLGNARVLLNFDATNALGAELPYTAECLFVAGASSPELRIIAR